MSCLTSRRRAWIQLLITKKEAQLLKAWATFEALLEQQQKSYKFDSKEGYQSLENIDIEKLQNVIDTLESEITALYRKLACKGILALNLRRKFRTNSVRGYPWR